MSTRSVLSHAFRLAGIALAAGVLASGSVLLPAGPFQASVCAAQEPVQPVPGVSLPYAAFPGAPSSPTADPGVIAYVDRKTTDIYLMQPDGAGDQIFWTSPPAEHKFVEIDLAWRPDGRELAFTSEHENACSWFDSDIFAIGYNGGYRRITNSPACAELARLPQGRVTVVVNNWTTTPIWVYVAGAPSVKWISGSGTVLFDKVADFGPDVHQPSIGVNGIYRFVSYPPYADVQPGKTVPGGNITVGAYSGFTGFGAGKISWKANSAALAYVLRSNTDIWQISASPSFGATGVQLGANQHTKQSSVAWGPTPATRDQYLYVSPGNILDEGYAGIWLTALGDTSGGERLVQFSDSDATRVNDVEWLPDGSGFLFSAFTVGLGFFANIYRYDFTGPKLTQLTDFPADVDLVQQLSISPDGQQVVFERIADDLDSNSSVWMMNIDGSDVHKLRDNAGRPAWGRTPVHLPVGAYLPLIVR